jgi:hypothetical protein
LPDTTFTLIHLMQQATLFSYEHLLKLEVHNTPPCVTIINTKMVFYFYFFFLNTQESCVSLFIFNNSEVKPNKYIEENKITSECCRLIKDMFTEK